LSDVGAFQQSDANVAMHGDGEWAILLSTKFDVSQPLNAGPLSQEARLRIYRVLQQIARRPVPKKSTARTRLLRGHEALARAVSRQPHDIASGTGVAV